MQQLVTEMMWRLGSGAKRFHTVECGELQKRAS
jgi:hypothetical protein